MDMIKNINEKNLLDFNNLVKCTINNEISEISNRIDDLDSTLEVGNSFVTGITQVDGKITELKTSNILISEDEEKPLMLKFDNIEKNSSLELGENIILCSNSNSYLNLHQNSIELLSPKIYSNGNIEIEIGTSDDMYLDYFEIYQLNDSTRPTATWTVPPTISENSDELVRGHELWDLRNPIEITSDKEGEFSFENQLNYRNNIISYENWNTYKLPLQNSDAQGNVLLLNIVGDKNAVNRNMFQLGMYSDYFENQNGDIIGNSNHKPLIYRSGCDMNNSWYPGNDSQGWVELLDTYGGQTICGDLNIDEGEIKVRRNIEETLISINEISITDQDQIKCFKATRSGVSISDRDYTTTISPTSLVAAGTITATQFNASSDKRLKENITPYKCNNSILNLPVYEFDYIKTNQHTIGCLAQDLQEICPEIVSQGEDGYLSISENKLVYLLLDEVKRLNSRIEVLEKERV